MPSARQNTRYTSRNTACSKHAGKRLQSGKYNTEKKNKPHFKERQKKEKRRRVVPESEFRQEVETTKEVPHCTGVNDDDDDDKDDDYEERSSVASLERLGETVTCKNSKSTRVTFVEEVKYHRKRKRSQRHPRGTWPSHFELATQIESEDSSEHPGLSAPVTKKTQNKTPGTARGRKALRGLIAAGAGVNRFEALSELPQPVTTSSETSQALVGSPKILEHSEAVDRAEEYGARRKREELISPTSNRDFRDADVRVVSDTDEDIIHGPAQGAYVDNSLGIYPSGAPGPADPDQELVPEESLHPNTREALPGVQTGSLRFSPNPEPGRNYFAPLSRPGYKEADGLTCEGDPEDTEVVGSERFDDQSQPGNDRGVEGYHETQRLTDENNREEYPDPEASDYVEESHQEIDAKLPNGESPDYPQPGQDYIDEGSQHETGTVSHGERSVGFESEPGSQVEGDHGNTIPNPVSPFSQQDNRFHDQDRGIDPHSPAFSKVVSRLSDHEISQSAPELLDQEETHRGTLQNNGAFIDNDSPQLSPPLPTERHTEYSIPPHDSGSPDSSLSPDFTDENPTAPHKAQDIRDFGEPQGRFEGQQPCNREPEASGRNEEPYNEEFGEADGSKEVGPSYTEISQPSDVHATPIPGLANSEPEVSFEPVQPLNNSTSPYEEEEVVAYHNPPPASSESHDIFHGDRGADHTLGENPDYHTAGDPVEDSQYRDAQSAPSTPLPNTLYRGSAEYLERPEKRQDFSVGYPDDSGQHPDNSAERPSSFSEYAEGSVGPHTSEGQQFESEEDQYCKARNSPPQSGQPYQEDPPQTHNEGNLTNTPDSQDRQLDPDGEAFHTATDLRPSSVPSNHYNTSPGSPRADLVDIENENYQRNFDQEGVCRGATTHPDDIFPPQNQVFQDHHSVQPVPDQEGFEIQPVSGCNRLQDPLDSHPSLEPFPVPQLLAADPPPPDIEEGSFIGVRPSNSSELPAITTPRQTEAYSPSSSEALRILRNPPPARKVVSIQTPPSSGPHTGIHSRQGSIVSESACDLEHEGHRGQCFIGLETIEVGLGGPEAPQDDNVGDTRQRDSIAKPMSQSHNSEAAIEPVSSSEVQPADMSAPRSASRASSFSQSAQGSPRLVEPALKRDGEVAEQADGERRMPEAELGPMEAPTSPRATPMDYHEPSPAASRTPTGARLDEFPFATRAATSGPNYVSRGTTMARSYHLYYAMGEWLSAPFRGMRDILQNPKHRVGITWFVVYTFGLINFTLNTYIVAGWSGGLSTSALVTTSFSLFAFLIEMYCTLIMTVQITDRVPRREKRIWACLVSMIGINLGLAIFFVVKHQAFHDDEFLWAQKLRGNGDGKGDGRLTGAALRAFQAAWLWTLASSIILAFSTLVLFAVKLCGVCMQRHKEKKMAKTTGQASQLGMGLNARAFEDV